MTPDQLITFAAVAEHLNISRAAAALHLSQPAVSGQLRLLAEEFGEPLYRRDGRGVALTPSGKQLAAYASRLRETYRQAHAYRDALRGLAQGTLRVGASTTPASYLLPYLIAAFRQRYPAVTVRTAGGNTADIVAALGELDIAIIEGPPPADLPPGTGLHPAHEDEIVAIVPRDHPLAGRPGGATFAELGAFAFVLREDGSGVRQFVEQAFEGAGVDMDVALVVAGVEGVKEAVRAGMGVGFVSRMAMRHEDGALQRISIAPRPLIRRFTVMVPHEGAPSRAAASFLQMCLNPAGMPQG
ncbi:LysR substrate-binding domain-containing protein [Trinickia caryophylli]|uniref:Transcriptional regulator, LysR family n=1 Tax=Trinickia caryophylli TaxID=28094 RepID=A0A1X7FY12_TRICW|nr:LysR family transcriptional regulator [Trinickia caryophylli]PMS11673.1 LysR family transcriptional regulator [Trinickia caryophylli]TRX17350.1 LysR family transcriptional regulator [Trinickia caryophylli]WQE11910.1 LysR substrate-binding domain-containing protein [Trinickia caryophylli]SMF60848.1 transcriptional regulator, LysR family [Trinickia caryophylli]GLU34581.1 LysR family transcriptional regulator [Trinickia caryophylli]